MTERARTYRILCDSLRFRSFTLRYKDADVWMAIDPSADLSGEARWECLRYLAGLYRQVEEHIRRCPEFGVSMQPLPGGGEYPRIIGDMLRAARAAGVGPMAAVAGAVADHLGRFALKRLQAQQVVVENGGDVFVSVTDPIAVGIHAGASPMTSRLALEIEGDSGPLGICTSSGTVGHAYSAGCADAFCIVCSDAARADAYATLWANQVKGPGALRTLVKKAAAQPEINSALAVLGDQLAYCGIHRLRFPSSEPSRSKGQAVPVYTGEGMVRHGD